MNAANSQNANQAIANEKVKKARAPVRAALPFTVSDVRRVGWGAERKNEAAQEAHSRAVHTSGPISPQLPMQRSFVP